MFNRLIGLQNDQANPRLSTKALIGGEIQITNRCGLAVRMHGRTFEFDGLDQFTPVVACWAKKDVPVGISGSGISYEEHRTLPEASPRTTSWVNLLGR